MSTMTLEQVRDWHQEYARSIRLGRIAGSAGLHEIMADAIEAHLAQPAQNSQEEVVPDGWRDAVKGAADALAYAAFNIDGSKLENLPLGITESTGASETALIAERDLRALIAAVLSQPEDGEVVS